METVRFDRHVARGIKRTPEGGIRVEAAIARVGVLEYANPDGSVRREARMDSDVFADTSLATANGVTVTDSHPTTLVTPVTFRDVTIGHVAEGSVRRDGRFVVADLIINHKPAVDAIMARERNDISCGYLCKTDETPGELNGERYDAIQREIRFNHVAILPFGEGRSGTDVRLRLDSAGNGIAPTNGDNEGHNDMTTTAPRDRVFERIDSAQYEVGTDAHRAAIDAKNKKDAETKARLDALEAKAATAADLAAQNDALVARVDALVAEIDTVKARHAAAAVGVRVEDSADLSAVRAAVISASIPHFDSAGKSDDYMAAAFDIALADLGKKRHAGIRAPLDTPNGDGSGARTDAIEDAIEKTRNATRNAWRNA